MTSVAAILPCRGRPEQTIRNVRRLLATAGDVDWHLYLVGVAADLQPLRALLPKHPQVAMLEAHGDRLTYWQAMQLGTNETTAPLIANLANDLLPGQHWLQRAVAAYQETWQAPDYGLLGFNDGHHETAHSCHFLIDRDLLTYLGGWPVWYDHAYGDTELCQKTIAWGFYAKAPWATLYHDHPYFGGDDDAVYQEGRRKVDRDYQLYETRRRAGWPTPTSP